MPIQSNNFDRFTDTREADLACLDRIGLACKQVAQPVCPVGKYPPGSGKTGGNLRRSHTYRVSADHVDVGVTADYGLYVHNGTSKQRANPWLRDSINANRSAIMELGVKAWQDNIGL